MNTQETQEQEVIAEEGVEETVEEIAESSDDSTEDDSTSEEAAITEPLQIDYKDKYEKLQGKIAGDAFKFRKSKKDDSAEDDDSSQDDDENRPLTRSEMEKMLEDRESKVIKQQSSKEALDVASSLTSSEDEAKYALALWENVSLPFETMEEQMKFIVAGMNAERTIAQNSELKRSLKSKDTARKNTATTARDAQVGTQPKLAADMTSVLKAQGYKFNSSQKNFQKKLSNGKTLFNDGKGKTWIV